MEHIRPTYARVDLSIIKKNVLNIKEFIRAPYFMAVVKANAYGHGMIPVAKALDEVGINYLGVGFLEEGIELRKNGVKTPILVLGGVLSYQISQFLTFNLDITVSSLSVAQKVNDLASAMGCKANVHLKIDSGMGRIGVTYPFAQEFIKRVSKMPSLNLIGIYSHLATAECKDKSFALEQCKTFKKVLKDSKDINVEFKFIHLANSGGILDLPETHFNIVRAGITIYGIYPSNESSKSFKIEQSLTLHSRVVFIKEVLPDTSISYGRKYYTKEKTKIATIPVGYGDGYPRSMSNKADVLINGNRFPVVGAVCMDQIMVDLGLNSGVNVGDDVVLYGKQGADEITMDEAAENAGTIPYEICCWINERVPRVYD